MIFEEAKRIFLNRGFVEIDDGSIIFNGDKWRQACVVISRWLEKEPLRPKAVWKVSNIPEEKYICSNCGGACWYYGYQGEVAKSNFCPNCGAKMVEPQAESEE